MAASRAKAPARGRTANGAGTVDEKTLRQLLAGLRAANAGDFDLRLEEGQGGLSGQLAKAFNDLADRRSALTDELQRVAHVVKRDGRLTERVSVPRARGAWKQAVEAVNGMIDDLVRPTTEIARVIDAVAEGDLSQKMDLRIDGRPLRGEFRRIGTTVNAMVDQLSSFADEVVDHPVHRLDGLLPRAAGTRYGHAFGEAAVPLDDVRDALELVRQGGAAVGEIVERLCELTGEASLSLIETEVEVAGIRGAQACDQLPKCLLVDGTGAVRRAPTRGRFRSARNHNRSFRTRSSRGGDVRGLQIWPSAQLARKGRLENPRSDF